MQARDATYTVIDFESTGSVPGFPDEPWQVGLVELRGGTVDAARAFESLLRVGERPFNPHAPGRHAERRDAIAAAPALPDLWSTVRARLDGRTLCAHNAATERRFLKRAYPLRQKGVWVDTLKLARLAWPTLRSHKLEELLLILGLRQRVETLCPGRQSHDALFDAFACGVLLETLLALPAWRHVSLEALVHARRP